MGEYAHEYAAQGGKMPVKKKRGRKAHACKTERCLVKEVSGEWAEK